jgi:hypothetical protein
MKIKLISAALVILKNCFTAGDLLNHFTLFAGIPILKSKYCIFASIFNIKKNEQSRNSHRERCNEN